MHRYLSTPPVFSAPAGQIDRDNGIIQGVTIAKTGMAKGHDAYIDRDFLLQLVDNATAKPAGIKARFGHPNMCSTALGSYLGRFRNYSYAGDSVKADLYLDETAKNSPSGDLYTYVLDMAAKNPDMFGASIHFEPDESLFLKERIEGKTIEREYFRLKELRATDIVDDPAATDGLFSATTFPGLASQFLDENPEMLSLIFSKPGSVLEFFQNYLNNTKMKFPDSIKQNFAAFLAAFSTKPEPNQSSEAAAELAEADETLDNLYASFCASFPETFSPDAAKTQLEKADAITEYLLSFNDKLLVASTKLSEITAAFDTLNAEHQELLVTSDNSLHELAASAAELAEAITKLSEGAAELAEANTRIEELTAQLNARPTIPLNVTDPLLSTGPEPEPDETGKEILKNIPKDLKRKLK